MTRTRTRETPAAKPDAHPAREAWVILMRIAKASRMTHLAALDLTFPQAQVLLHLEPDRPAPMSELASALSCDASNITGLVDRLEARSLIERRTGTEDRRVKMAALTRAGSEMRRKLQERWMDPPAQIAALSARDQETLLAILKRADGAAAR